SPSDGSSSTAGTLPARLAGDAEDGERDGAQPRDRNRRAAVGAGAVAPGVQARERRVDLLHGAVERLEDGDVASTLAARLPAVHALAVARRSARLLVRQHLAVARLGLAPPLLQEQKELRAPPTPGLVLAHRPILRR